MLAERVNGSRIPKVDVPILPSKILATDQEGSAITQTWIWDRIAEFLQPGDVILGETGTAAFGLPDATFPKDTTYEAPHFDFVPTFANMSQLDHSDLLWLHWICHTRCFGL